METKQVIIIRKDLNMRKGKMIAMGSHASMGAIFSKSHVNSHPSNPEHNKEKVIGLSPILEEWFNDKFTKIVVGCNNEQELLALAKKAEDAGMLHFLCKDAGLTEFNGIPTYTSLAIGPCVATDLDKLTSHLKLL